ncbi:oligopeptide transport system permease protein [Fontibacillus panacisegetis]|uniref:Oligopeptide transport system permease protein n=1 Tax=Fontibacillus panacisegetis TaxID=670482 RepID=A0A1G7M098_9BACL|nr:oligopeptide ABC transporter permease [Fontibacillus panacisegetis]SDF55081.1 oligopeptide transport system permease protein [Fontibacillus panacisegetis]
MTNYIKFIAKRLAYMIVTLLLISQITFLLMNFLPGSPYSNEEKLTPQQLEIMNEKYGLSKPFGERYLLYMSGIVRGDFGISLQFSNQPVSKLLSERIGPSMQLGIQAMIFGTIVGIVLGTVSALHQNSFLDALASLSAIIGRSIPNFVFAVLLQLIFAITLKWLPIALWNDGFSSTILPTLALSITPMADAARFIRTEMIEVLNSDYVELARAKGQSERRIAIVHGLRNALIPLLTLLGPMTVGLMTGSLVVENIFAIPGIGEQFVKSILTNDYSTIMGVTLIYSAMLVTVILIVDILYGIIDPRIRVAGGKS